jgi:RHS repeat-associated protein
VWTKDPDGFLSYAAYDVATGAVVKTIADVNTANTGDFVGLPAGWSTPAGGGLHLVGQYEVDALGRDTRLTDPNGNVTYTVYNDPNHEVRTYAGWQTSGNTPTGPTQVVREDRPGGYTEVLTMSAAPAVSGGRPTGTEAVSGLQSLTRVYANLADQAVRRDDYVNFDGLTYSTGLYLGTQGANYYATQFAYDQRGRPNRTVSPTGTITRTVYDGLGRVVSTWVGTNDTPASGYWAPDNNTAPSDMVQVSANVYDGGGVGDGNLTQTTAYSGGGAAPRVTQFFYDWRDRLVATAVASNDLPPAPQPLAAGFETPAVGTGSGAYQYNPGGTPWTYSSLSGVAGNGSGFTFTNPPAPEGTQVAFLQTTGTISQTVTLAAGTYALSFKAAQRGSFQSSAQTFQVVVDGTAVGTFTPAGPTYADRATTDFTVTAGAHTILFQGLNPNGGDNTALIDQVRILARDGVHRPITYYDYDNLDEVVAAERYDGDDVTVTDGNGDGVPDRPSADLLRARATTDYDERGRAYRTRTYSVAPSTGAVSANALTTNVWYDLRGHVIKTAAPGGLVTKVQYDGAGRAVTSFTTDGGGDAAYADAGTVTGDVVLEQAETQYDGDGNALLTTTRQRFHDASWTGDLRPAGAAARFVRADAATQGSWQGAYGQDGYSLAQGASSLPSYAQVSLSGQSNATWAASTTDVRALQKPGASDRLAACWWSSGSFTIDVTLTDGQAHQVGLYLLDWDNFQGGRTERVDMLNAETGDVLDSRTVSAFGGGVYAVWSLRGHVQLRLTNLSGPSSNAVASGLFFDPASAPPAPPARVSSAAAYYDAAGRLTAAVAVGTNGGAAWTRPGTVPSRSDTALVTSYAYDAAGRLATVTDPRGITGQTYYDALGRTTKAVEAYTDGVVTAATNRTTEYTYDGADHLLSYTARLEGTAAQTTAYVYGVGPADGSVLTSNDLLLRVEHPDPATGLPVTDPSAHQWDAYTYNALGDPATATDRNGTTHAYTFDVLGRPTADAVTALGAGVDGAVRRLETAYDGQGNASLFTSYDATAGGTVVNQVLDQFNGLGQLTAEYQEHSGAVNTLTSPAVQYAYSFVGTAGGPNHSRLMGITYPNGRVVNDTYGPSGGLNDRISRLDALTDGTGTLEAYSYLGLGTVVTRSHPQPGVDLTYVGTGTGDAGDQYTGLDRFGRVADQRWVKTGTGAATDEFRYGYDRASNPLYKENLVNGTLSDLYAYDDLDQLLAFQRGTLNATKDGLTGTASRSQSWALDALGNFAAVTTDGTPEARTHNQQNQVTGVGGSTLTYDAAGTLTTDETGRQLAYDAWGRLVTVKDSGGTTLEALGSDALGRRVTESAGGTTKDLYYSTASQVLEERVGGQAVAQYVWSPVYVDALVERDRDADGSTANGLEERLWVQQDANFNVTALVNAAGAVVARYVYDPYGQATALDASWAVRAGGSAYGWVYGFQGLRSDGVSGLSHARGRDYSPALGRPVQSDPLGLAPDANSYRWEGDNPINRVDPSGLWWEDFKRGLQVIGDSANNLAHGRVNPDFTRGLQVIGDSANNLAHGRLNPDFTNGARMLWQDPWTNVPEAAKIAVKGAADGFNHGPMMLGQGLAEGNFEKIWMGLAESALTLMTARLFFGEEAAARRAAGRAAAEADEAATLRRLRPGEPAEAKTCPTRKSCFPAGTPVHTTAGLKAIERIAAGDRVWSYDHKELRWVEREVVEVYQLRHRGTMATLRVRNETMRATGGHPFWVVRGECLADRPSPVRIAPYEKDGRQQGRWVLARDLRAGDEVLLRSGEVVALDSVQLDEVREQVYNFHVAELQNYAVGSCGILVHNQNDPALQPAMRYKKGPNDVDWRGTGKTYREALDEAFQRTGHPREEFTATQWAKDANGKSHPVEWRHADGSEVNIDWPHVKNGPDVPHVGWQTGGKRSDGGAQRGHIFLDDVPYNRSPIKGRSR